MTVTINLLLPFILLYSMPFITDTDILKQNRSKYNIVNLCGLCRMLFMLHQASLNTKL